MEQTHFETPYDAGFDAGRYGVNTFNSHFKWFTTKESTEEWQRGNDLGSKKREADRKSKKQNS